jgi:hypothetical protein
MYYVVVIEKFIFSAPILVIDTSTRYNAYTICTLHNELVYFSRTYILTTLLLCIMWVGGGGSRKPGARDGVRKVRRRKKKSPYLKRRNSGPRIFFGP